MDTPDAEDPDVDEPAGRGAVRWLLGRVRIAGSLETLRQYSPARNTTDQSRCSSAASFAGSELSSAAFSQRLSRDA
jgi:hypothetical protein